MVADGRGVVISCGGEGSCPAPPEGWVPAFGDPCIIHSGPTLSSFPRRRGTHPPSTARAGTPSARGRLRGNDGRGKVARRWIPELWQWPKMGSRLRGKDEFRAAVFPVGAYPRADGGLPPCRRGAGMGSRLQRPLHNPRRPNLIVFPAKAGTHPCPAVDARPRLHGGRPFAGKTVIQRSLSTGRTSFGAAVFPVGACPRADGEPAPVQTGSLPPCRRGAGMGSRLRGKDEFQAAVFPVGAYPRADGGLPPCRRGAGMGSRLQRPLHNPRRPNLIVFPAKAGTHPCPAVDARPRLHGGQAPSRARRLFKGLSPREGRVSGQPSFPWEPAPVQTGSLPPCRRGAGMGSRLRRPLHKSCGMPIIEPTHREVRYAPRRESSHVRRCLDA